MQFEVVGGIMGEGWLLGLVSVSVLVVCEWERFGISLGVGSGGCWLVLVVWGLDVVLGVV